VISAFVGRKQKKGNVVADGTKTGISPSNNILSGKSKNRS